MSRILFKINPLSKLSKISLSVLFQIFLLLVFLLGLYLFSTGRLYELKMYENMDVDPSSNTVATKTGSCPDLLVRRNGQILLFRSQEPLVEGVNPIVFRNLDEYIAYYSSQGGSCPALFLQQETDAQGNDVYRMRPSPFDQQGGLPPVNTLSTPTPVVIDKQNPIPYVDANVENPPYNQGQYAGFDPQGQFVGRYTNLDKIHDSTQQLFPGGSPNPMDDNWGGVLYTEKILNTGYYDNNNVQILTG